MPERLSDERLRRIVATGEATKRTMAAELLLARRVVEAGQWTVLCFDTEGRHRALDAVNGSLRARLAAYDAGHGEELAEFQGWLTEERADRIVKLSRAFQDREEKSDE